MRDIIEFIAGIPWWGWGVVVVWYVFASVHWEELRVKQMTPEERQEYEQQKRRKMLGLED